METTINFSLERANKGDGKTFSAEGIYGFLGSIGDCINRSMQCLIRKGFEKNEPVEKLVIDLGLEINDKAITNKELEDVLKEYPNLAGFTSKFLADRINEAQKTEWEKAQEEKIEGKEFKIEVVNREAEKEFRSEFETIEQALHKIKLDIITSIKYDFKNPILVYVKKLNLLEI